jgi:hypothetical protein
MEHPLSSTRKSPRTALSRPSRLRATNFPTLVAHSCACAAPASASAEKKSPVRAGLGGGAALPGPHGRRNDQSSPEQTWAILDGPAGHAMSYSVDRISPDDVVKTPDGNIRVTITGKINGKKCEML